MSAVVPTPWRHESLQLEKSFYKALTHCLGQQKKDGTKKAELKRKLDEFISEYRELGHMVEVLEALRVDVGGEVYSISYLNVLRKDATTKKLRNVFITPSASALIREFFLDQSCKLISSSLLPVPVILKIEHQKPIHSDIYHNEVDNSLLQSFKTILDAAIQITGEVMTSESLVQIIQ